MGVFNGRSPRELLARRGGAIAAVAALHVAAFAVLLHVRYNDRPAPEGVAIQVTNLDLPLHSPEPAPDLQVELREPEFEIVVPVVAIQLESPPPAAITPPPPPPSHEPAATLQVAAPVMLDVDEVDYLRPPAPRYPRSAKQARVQGTVLVWVLIDTEGRPQQVRIHRSSGYELLDLEGSAAVKAALFKPYRRDGVALAAQVIVPVEFALTVRTARR